MHSTKNLDFGIVSCEKLSRKDVISQIGKMGFQKGWSHAIRNLGQLCELPCSFDVFAKHRIWGVRVGLCLMLPPPYFPLSLNPSSMLFAAKAGWKGLWDRIDIFPLFSKTISVWSLMVNWPIVFPLNDIFCLFHFYFYSQIMSLWFTDIHSSSNY